jgi:methionine-rich copper-binding protein CopC
MKRMTFLMTAALLTFTIGARAHTHLEASMPAENAVLDAAPADIMLHFSEPTRLTALSIQKDGGDEQQAISVLSKEKSAAFTVPLPALAAGRYAVNWRAVGDDNHVMSGVLHFTVKGK